MSVSIFDFNLESVNTFKYLGIILATDFTWSDHVEHVISNVNKRLSFATQDQAFSSFNHTPTFFCNNLILSIFEYVDVVRGAKNNVSIKNDFQVLQNKAAKIILDRPLHSSVIIRKILLFYI